MSDFWERKIKTHFDFADFNKDGVITVDDFQLMAAAFAEAGEVSTDRKSELRNLFLEGHKDLSSATGSEEGGVAMTQSMYVESMRKMKNTPKLTTLSKNLADIGFSILDSNHDGYIDETEYVRFLSIFRVPDSVGAAKIAMKDIDTNEDGLISSSEFTCAVLDFFGSDDPNGVGKNFLGPLLY